MADLERAIRNLQATMTTRGALVSRRQVIDLLYEHGVLVKE